MKLSISELTQLLNWYNSLCTVGKDNGLFPFNSDTELAVKIQSELVKRDTAWLDSTKMVFIYTHLNLTFKQRSELLIFYV